MEAEIYKVGRLRQKSSVALFGLLLVTFLLIGLSAQSAEVEGGSTAAPEWTPYYLEIGMSDLPTRPAMFQFPEGIGYRQQYLSGGAGTGWTNWNNNGDFAKFYIQKSIELETIPIFTWYMICQSGHGGAGNGSHPCYGQEQETIKNNLADSGTMYQFWADMRLFYDRAAEFPDQTVILHVEPDMWGHLQQMSNNDDAAQYPHAVRVGGSGHPDLSGLPDTPQGFADALYRLRDAAGAQNVLVGYHVSMWGTMNDFVLSNPNPDQLQSLAAQSVRFYQSLDREFDVSFFEMRDRDAGFYEVQYGQPNLWWQQNDYDNHIAWINRYHDDTGQSVVMWQLPYGNTKRAEMDNSWGHYRDNIVETLLGEEDLSTLKRYRDAGVVAIVFGQGASGTTCPCDSDNDGQVDDGGYFYEVATRYGNGNQLVIDPSLPPPGSTATPTPEIITVNARVDQRLDNGIVIRWDDIGAESYELWWSDSENLMPGPACQNAGNCLIPDGTAYQAILPDGVSTRYFVIAARDGTQLSTFSNVLVSFRVTNKMYLPAMLR